LLGFLPLLALAASVYAFRRSGSAFSTSFFRGAVVWGVALVAITESLSAFVQLDLPEVAIAWALFCVATVVVASRYRSPDTAVTTGTFTADATSGNDGLLHAQLLAIVLIALTALFLACVAAPSTADSMTYHLPRVEHWIQNRSVAPYRSNIERQLWPGPGAEYIMLHVESLSRSDRGVTLIQWAAYIANIIAASLIAAELGLSRRGRVLAAFLAATIPGAVAQATGAQVELVFSFWLACSVYLGLRLGGLRKGDPWLAAAAAFGAAVGIAIFTKATAYVYFAPFAIWFFVATVRKHRLGAARLWIVAGLIALAINAPAYYRNMVLYGNPLSRPGADGVVNSSFFVGGAISNVVRNVSLHFGTPIGPVNNAVESGINSIDASLGVLPNDERTTFPRQTFHFLGNQSAEQTAGSPVQVLIAFAALGFLIIAGRNKFRTQLEYMLCVAAGFLLFCFYLRWQPWHARLHVPLLMLAVPACAFVLEQVKRRWIIGAISALAFVVALPPLVRNPARPLFAAQPVFTIPREQQYFAERTDLYAPYVAATDYLKSIQCHDIGLWVRGDGAEYPIWALLRTRGRDGVRIRHVSIANHSADLAQTPAGDNFTPCALMFVASSGRSVPLVIPAGYTQAWRQGDIMIYRQEGSR
jgi:hypothetical protein